MAGTTVTGDWAGQNINLRNAATESTLNSVLLTMESLRKIAAQVESNTKAMSSGSKPGAIQNAAEATAAALVEAAGAGSKTAGKLKDLEGETSVFGKTMKIAGMAAGAFSAILYKVSGSIRNMDSGIDNLGGGIRGITDSFGGLGDLVQASLEQVQKSYGAFSQMAQAGYSGASNIDNLSGQAASLAMSLPQYTNMMTSMAGTFAAGGNNMTVMSNKFLANIRKLTDNVDGTSVKLTRMGIPLQQQAEFASRLVQAQGSYARVLEISGGDFNGWLMKSTDRLLKLSRVTGQTTDALLAQEAALQKDPGTFFDETMLRAFYRENFEGIKDSMKALTGGDAIAAQKMMADRAIGRPDATTLALQQIAAFLPNNGRDIQTLSNTQASAAEVAQAIKNLQPAIIDLKNSKPEMARMMLQLSSVSPDIRRAAGLIMKMGIDSGENADAQGNQAQAQIDMSQSMKVLAEKTANVNKEMITLGINLGSLAIDVAMAGKALQTAAVNEVAQLLKDQGIDGVSIQTIQTGMTQALKEYQRTTGSSPFTPGAGSNVSAEDPNRNRVQEGNGRVGFDTTTPAKAQRITTGQVSSAAELYSYMISKGISPDKAQGILANMMRESQLDAGVSVKDTNGLTSGGLIQWNGPRFDKMVSALGTNWRKDPKGQIDYMIKENPAYFKKDFGGNATDAAHSFYTTVEQPLFGHTPSARTSEKWGKLYRDQWGATQGYLEQLRNKLPNGTSTSVSGAVNSSTTTSAAQISSGSPISPLVGGTGGSIAEEDKAKAAAAGVTQDGKTGTNNSAVTASAPPAQDTAQSALDKIAQNTRDTVATLDRLATKLGIPKASMVNNYGFPLGQP